MDRRKLIAGIGLAAIAPTTATAQTDPDPLVAIYKDWIAKRERWRVLAELPGNENFDSPEMLALESEGNALLDQAARIEATTLEGARSLAKMLLEETGSDSTRGSRDYYVDPTLQDNQMLARIAGVPTNEPDSFEAIE